jgi:hypothetical protein
MYVVSSSTTCVANKVDPHKIQRLATIVMWHPKDIMKKTQPNVQCGEKNIQKQAKKKLIGQVNNQAFTPGLTHNLKSIGR